MAAIVMAVIITLSIVLGAELGPKADPTTTHLRAAAGVVLLLPLRAAARDQAAGARRRWRRSAIPTICMILLFLLPFIDRGPERRPERRPIATFTGIFVICAMAYLTYLGADAGSPNEIDTEGRAPQYEAGKLVVAQSGCLACHKIGENGNDGPGPHLTRHRRQAAARRRSRGRSRTRRRRCRRSRACRGEEVRARRLPLAAQERRADAQP